MPATEALEVAAFNFLIDCKSRRLSLPSFVTVTASGRPRRRADERSSSPVRRPVQARRSGSGATPARGQQRSRRDLHRSSQGEPRDSAGCAPADRDPELCESILMRKANEENHQFAKPSTNGRYLRIPAGWSRRRADIADRDRERLNWAGSAPTGVASGRPECAPKPPFHRQHETAPPPFATFRLPAAMAAIR